MLIVLTIAGLLVALVPPAISAAMPGARLKVATRDFARTLRESRNLAVSQGAEVDVVIGTEPLQYTISGGMSQEFPRGVDLSIRNTVFAQSGQSSSFADALSSDDFTLRFYPDGSASAAQIKISQGRSAYLIDIDWLIGSVSVSKGTGDVY